MDGRWFTGGWVGSLWLGWLLVWRGGVGGGLVFGLSAGPFSGRGCWCVRWEGEEREVGK